METCDGIIDYSCIFQYLPVLHTLILASLLYFTDDHILSATQQFSRLTTVKLIDVQNISDMGILHLIEIAPAIAVLKFADCRHISGMSILQACRKLSSLSSLSMNQIVGLHDDHLVEIGKLECLFLKKLSIKNCSQITYTGLRACKYYSSIYFDASLCMV
jgi:hypothetical protein